MIHYLFLGHFEHDGEMVRFSKSPSDLAYRPVVRRSLDSARTNEVLFTVATSVLACELPQPTSEDACGYGQTRGPWILH